MSPLSCDMREDPVARKVRDLTAAETVAWMVEYHGLNPSSAKIIESNLREQFCWHRLQGRLDQNSTAGLVAQLLLMRQSPMVLEKPAESKEENHD